MSRLTSVHPKPTASPLLPVVLLLLCTLSLLATPGQSAATSFTVTPSAGANGTISPNTPQSVTSGANLTFTAAANAGYTVDCWALDSAVVQIGNARYLLKNITAGHTVKVTFKSLPTVTVTPVAGTNGAIAPHTPQAVLPGASLAFTATANAGYTVDTWFLDYAYAQSGGAQYTLANITASHTVSVNFKALGPYVITPNAGANGTINPYSARIMPYGSSLTFTATAVAGYTADCWYLDGTSIQTGGALYTLNNITANHAVKVTFKLIPVPGGRGEWWLFRHDLLHTGRSPYVGPTGTRQKWVTPYTASAGFYVVSSPSLGVDGTLYVGSQASNKLYAIRPDGTVKWTFSTQGVVISTPAIDTDGTIYFGANDNNFYAVRPDGTAKWAHPFVTGGNIQCSPAIGVDGTVYVGSYDGNLYAINPDGSRKWAYYVSNQVFSSPAIAADGTLYLGTDIDQVLALNPNGTLKWAFPIGNWATSSPAIGADGTIYIGSWDTKCYAINPNGTAKWAQPFATKQMIRSSPGIGADGTIYLGSTDGSLYALAPDGSKKWAYATGGAIISSPTIGANGVIYFGSFDDKLYALNAKGSAVWTAPLVTGGIIGASPTIAADGTLYVGSQDGKLYALGSTAPATLTITPSAGANGTITPNTPQMVNTGASLTLSAAANAGYTVDSWALDSAVAQTGGVKYTLSNITASHTVKVTFKTLLSYTVTSSAGANGTITPNTPQTVNTGTSLTLTATANAGYTVDTWTLDSTAAQIGGAKYTLNNITASHTVKVTFKTLLSYTVTPSAGANGTITPNIPQTVLYGGNVTFIATANAGYTTDSWSLDGIVAQPGGAQYALSNVTANHVINVTFKPCLPYQPDLAIRTSSETSYTGFGIYNLTGANQTKSLTVATSVTAVYLFAVKNAGSLADTFTLHCSSVDPTWRVQCINRDSGGDVTASFVGTQGATVSLTLGSVANYTLDLTPYANAKTMTVTISATSAADGTKQDVIKTVSTKQ